MRVLVLSHRAIANELGHLEPWLDEVASNGLVRAYREDGLPTPAMLDADLLVLLGSPGSVATGHCSSIARAEIDLVHRWVTDDRPYLGICFGAQVLACALGGSVHRLPDTYRAYAELPVTSDSPADLAGPWVLWHQDAITAPAGATHLARLAHADVAFCSGRAWGLQPHIEVTSASLERMLRAIDVNPAEADPIVQRVRRAEASADPPAHRVARLMGAFEAEAFGG